MKTAGRENPNHGVAVPRNRAHGAVGQNRSCSIKWAGKQEKFRPQEECFFLTSPFIELIRTWPNFLGSEKQSVGIFGAANAGRFIAFFFFGSPREAFCAFSSGDQPNHRKICFAVLEGFFIFFCLLKVFLFFFSQTRSNPEIRLKARPGPTLKPASHLFSFVFSSAIIMVVNPPLKLTGGNLIFIPSP